MRQSLKILSILVWLLLSVFISFSQDTESEAYDTVLGAVESLTDGYTYTQKISINQTFISEDDRFDTLAVESVDGEVDADQNFYVERTFRGGESQESLADSPTFTMQLLSLDDTLYLTFENIDLAFGTQFADIEEGWQSLDDLMSIFTEGDMESLVITNLSNITIPTDFPLTNSLILSIEEQEPEIVDGQSMRVFQVEVDAQRIFISQLSGSLEEQLTTMLESAGLFAKSEFELVYTLWIGADDGLLYGGESEGYTYLPYYTELEDGPPYDITTEYDSSFTIAEHGQTEAIQLPDELD